MTVTKDNKRRVLIVSFYFPPANSIAAVRIGKFAKYLSQFGWEPIVLTVNEVKGQPQTLPLEIDEAKIVRAPYFSLAAFTRDKLVGDENTPSQEVSKGLSWGGRVYQLIRLTRFIYTRPEVNFFTDELWGWYPHALAIPFKLIDLKFSHFIKQFKSISLSAIGMGGIVFALSLFMENNLGVSNLIILVSSVVIGVASYAGILFVLDKSLYHEVFQLLKQLKSSPSAVVEVGNCNSGAKKL